MFCNYKYDAKTKTNNNPNPNPYFIFSPKNKTSRQLYTSSIADRSFCYGALYLYEHVTAPYRIIIIIIIIIIRSSKFASLWSSDLSRALKSLCCWGLGHYMSGNLRSLVAVLEYFVEAA